jgi:hypothetical protein
MAIFWPLVCFQRKQYCQYFPESRYASSGSMRASDGRDISGNFCDHHLQELHCNAHADNLIVLLFREGNTQYQLVTFVDFDMTFTKEQAVFVWTDPPQPDPEIVTFQFAAEFGSFVQDLAGITAVVSDVLTAVVARKQEL